MVKQGELLQKIKDIVDVVVGDNYVDVKSNNYPYVFIMSQNCDIVQTFTMNLPAHQRLHKIIACPAYPFEQFNKKIHTLCMETNVSIIDDYDSTKKHGKYLTKYIKDKLDPRYHYIESVKLKLLPFDVVIDFKHFFTLGYENLYNQLNDKTSKGVLPDLVKEDLTLRFSQYVSRIGLPENEYGLQCRTFEK